MPSKNTIPYADHLATTEGLKLNLMSGRECWDLFGASVGEKRSIICQILRPKADNYGGESQIFAIWPEYLRALRVAASAAAGGSAARCLR